MSLPLQIITNPSLKDKRGLYWTTWKKGICKKINFNHDKFSISKKNTLRGIHCDYKSWRLVTCVYGEITQVLVDLRKDSNTYLKWQSYKINKEEQKMVLIPPGCGNAYYVSSKHAVYHYKLAYEGAYLDAAEQFSVRWDDPSVGVKWPVSQPFLSKRDLEAPFVK